MLNHPSMKWPKTLKIHDVKDYVFICAVTEYLKFTLDIVTSSRHSIKSIFGL